MQIYANNEDVFSSEEKRSLNLVKWVKLYINPFATDGAYMCQHFHCLQCYAGNEGLNKRGTWSLGLCLVTQSLGLGGDGLDN